MSAAEKDINTALSARLAEFQTAGEPPVAWENAPYNPEIGEMYLAESFMPNIKDAVGMAHASADDYEGMYQISVLTARGSRRFEAQEQARLLSLHFPRGAEYVYNGVKVKITGSRIGSSIIETTSIGSFSGQDNWFQIPLTISWRAIV